MDISKNNKYIDISKIKFDKVIRQYSYTTSYFIKSNKILKKFKKDNKFCTMQFIHFSDEIVMAGKQEVIKLLKFCLSKKILKKINVYIANDGDILYKNTPIMIIEGRYIDFGWLENIIDGILAQRCSVATNTYNLMKYLLPHQEIIYMSDRTRNYFDQSYDAYPAYLMGIKLFVTKKQISFFEFDKNVKIIGTIPHALIQQYKNNLIEMIKDYKKIYQTDKLYCLIDYENDVIKTLNQIKPIINLIDGVRIDTSNKLIDKNLKDKSLFGVNSKLIEIVYQWFIKNKIDKKKIIVTSNIDPMKIKSLNQDNNYIDYFGVGGYFNYPSVHVSADLVKFGNENEAKFGRKYLNNAKKLPKVQFS